MNNSAEDTNFKFNTIIKISGKQMYFTFEFRLTNSDNMLTLLQRFRLLVS